MLSIAKSELFLKGVYILFGVLIILGLVARFWKLSQVPVSLYHDEMDFVITGEAITRYGTDLSGDWSPTQLRPLRTLNYASELPAVFHALSQVLFSSGVTSAHLPAAIFGVLSCIALGVAGLVLTGSVRTGVFAATVLLITPWHIHISRTGYEAGISLFFQIVLVIVVLYQFRTNKITNQEKGILLCTVICSFVMGFYTYHAAKFTISSIAFLGSVAVLFSAQEFRWRVLLSVSLFILPILFLTRTYQIGLSGGFGERESELISMAFLSKEVDHSRRLAIIFPLTNTAINKPSVFLDAVLKRYAFVFDLNRLFFTGSESGYQFSLLVHGFFPVLFLPLLFLGVSRMVSRKKLLCFVFLALFFLSPVASTISVSYQSIFRSALTYALLCILIAVGWSSLLKIQGKWSNILLGVILGLFVLQTTWFALQYFTQYPTRTADNHYFQEELLAGYLSELSTPAVIHTEGLVYSPARSVLAYTNSLEKLTQQQREQFFDPKISQIEFDSFRFAQGCPAPDATQSAVVILEPGLLKNCGFEGMFSQRVALASAIDSRAYYVVLNDTLCTDQALEKFIRSKQLFEYNPVSLSRVQLCQSWVIRQ